MSNDPKVIAKAWMLRKPTGGIVREFGGEPTLYWRKRDALGDQCEGERVIRVAIVEVPQS